MARIAAKRERELLSIPFARHNIVTVVEKRYKAHHQRKDFSQETLQPGPELFNGIELRGVRWKEQNSASCVLGSKKQPLFEMERSIVHYNHGSLLQRRQKLVGKPEFKKSAVHRSAILKRRENSVAHLSGDNAASLVLSTTNLPQYLLAPQCIPIFPIRRYFLLVLPLIAGCLFFLVILCRRNASRMPLSLHPNASAISV